MRIFFTSLCILISNISFAVKWQVGPARTYTYCSQVAPLVQDGDTIEIDYAVYVNDPQVHWTKNNLYIKGVGGRPRLQAGNIIANDMVNGKGIFVISGANVKVEYIEFANATVQDHNGAGIRQEGGNLWVSSCKFDGNEMGILCGNIPNCKTTVQYSEFVNGGSMANPGYQHNIYINHIDTLLFMFNYSHEAIAEGHELKSRATNNFILYNRIANESSVDSRTIDLPNGGSTLLVGNIIEQGPNSANSNLLGYGMEGLTNPGPHTLRIFNNTFVNKKTTGSFIQMPAGTDTLLLKNNILAGAKTGGLLIGTAAYLDSSHNLVNDTPSAFGFVNLNGYNYNLTPISTAVNAGINIPGSIAGHLFNAEYMYRDTCIKDVRAQQGTMDIGAYEYFDLSSAGNIELPTLHMYPNPCTNSMHIRGTHTSPYYIFDFCGRLLYSGVQYPINTSALQSGIYLLRTNEGKAIFRKE